MKKVFGYIRVSTVKQGTGVSLQAQKEAIIRYAEKHQLEIIEWFEEQETAAKQGRPLFTKMMKLIRSGKSRGVIIHKIDRGARNLKDWGVLGDLIDEGYEIHFAHESLDMDTRGGRLAADIQAVIASDYIRNLREETQKGITGRLKQGFYPFRAPIGYVNNGGGKVKTIDSIKGPIVKKAFLLYSSNKYNLEKLCSKMQELGLTNEIGNKISITSMSKILNNPFYAGILKVNAKTYQGIHEPLISPSTFTQVQNILTGKTNSQGLKHNFLFRRYVKCESCRYSLIGERQKGNVYYRCHSKICQIKTIREELLEMELHKVINKVQLSKDEGKVLDELLLKAQSNWINIQSGIEESLNLQHSKASQKMDKLTDALLDSLIEKEIFEQKKKKIIFEIQDINQRREKISSEKDNIFKKAKNYIELAKSVRKSYLNGNPEDKRDMLKIITSNFTINQNNLMFTIKSPFAEIANRYNSTECAPSRDVPRIKFANLASTNDHVIDNTKLKTDIPADSKMNGTLNIPMDKEKLIESMQSLLDLILSKVEKLEDLKSNSNQ
ncbi:MAG: recombinase family protein [Saprospiraceae bacterium]|nr:recombinase family protein [Saprospiraceae bacterium]